MFYKVREYHISTMLSYFSRVTSIGVAFGIAGAVFVSACGAAFSYLSGKVEEERAKMNKSNGSSDS